MLPIPSVGRFRAAHRGPVEWKGQCRILCGILFRSVVCLEEAEQFGMLPGLYHAVDGDAAEQTAVFLRGLRVFRSPGYFGRDASAGFPVVTVGATQRSAGQVGGAASVSFAQCGEHPEVGDAGVVCVGACQYAYISRSAAVSIMGRA